MPVKIYIFSIAVIWSREVAVLRQCADMGKPWLQTSNTHGGNGWKGQAVVIGGASSMGHGLQAIRWVSPCCGSAVFLQQPAEVELLVSFRRLFCGAQKKYRNAVMCYSGVYISKCAACNNVKQYQYEKVVCYVRFRLCNFKIFILCLKNFAVSSSKCNTQSLGIGVF